MASMYYLSAAHPFAVPCIKFPPAEVCLQDADPGRALLAGYSLACFMCFRSHFFCHLSTHLVWIFLFSCRCRSFVLLRFDCRTLVYVSSYVFGFSFFFGRTPFFLGTPLQLVLNSCAFCVFPGIFYFCLWLVLNLVWTGLKFLGTGSAALLIFGSLDRSGPKGSTGEKCGGRVVVERLSS